MSGIVAATKAYERWLGDQVTVVKADLRWKHEEMESSSSAFLRATFYRWLEVWSATLSELASGPTVLAIGDLHVENFGTWRDAEQRLAWGVNDFDEAHPLPYTQDLVRLATSALLLVHAGTLPIGGPAACEGILDGYSRGLKTARPFVLAERNRGLAKMARRWRDRSSKFWARARNLPGIEAGSIPSGARALLLRSLGDAGSHVRVARRRGGLGGLGRPRFVGMAERHGGWAGREVKALVPSAAAYRAGTTETYGAELLRVAVRDPDPFVVIDGAWLLRRFGPEHGKLEVGVVRSEEEAARLLRAMGAETANVHLGSPAAVPAVRAHLTGLGRGWLADAGGRMADALERDWTDWRGRK